MGIQGLLPALKSITTLTNVKEYSGMRVAVDTYSWLHKAAMSCSKDICNGVATSSFINYCMHRVNLLRHHGVKPLLVFDGGTLPMKAGVEEKRSRARKEHLERARQCEAAGNHAVAYEHYQKAVDITPEIAYQLILVLRRENVDFIVSPYEADAQMAFLSLRGVVDAVITEDSDLVAYGCPKILFKMDKCGQGVELQYADLVKNKDLNFTSFTKKMILEMCIFSGCDYLPSLQGMGVKRAHNLMRRFRSHEKVIRHLKFSGVAIPKSYEEGFEKALLTFNHHLVYDPTLEDAVHLSEVPADYNGGLEFLGPTLPRTLVQQIVHGLIHPVTHASLLISSPSPSSLSLDNVSPASDRVKRYLKGREEKHLKLPAQRNVLTNYFISKSAASTQQFKAPRPSDEVADSPEVSAQSYSPVNNIAKDCVPSSDNAVIKKQEDIHICHDSKRVCIEYDESINDDTGPVHCVRAYSIHKRKVLARSNYLYPDPNDENQEVKRNSDCSIRVKRKSSPPAEPSFPKFSSNLLGVSATLSAKVDHTRKYCTIAQESVERFTRTISSVAHGARVSGLRPPLKNNLTNINREACSKDDLFNEFALTAAPSLTSLWRRV